MFFKNVSNTAPTSGATSPGPESNITTVPQQKSPGDHHHPHFSSLSSQPRPGGASKSPILSHINKYSEFLDSSSSADASTALTLANIVPPLLMGGSSIEAGENIDWNASSKISSEHIEGIRQRISKSFPEAAKPLFSWQPPPSPYPDEHLRTSLGFYPKNHSYAKYSNKSITERYNPYSFRMPYGLQSFEHWFNQSNVFSSYDEERRGGYMAPGMTPGVRLVVVSFES